MHISMVCKGYRHVFQACSYSVQLLHLFHRHTAVLVESIKKGIRDADSEARVEARKYDTHRHFLK